MKRSMVEDQQNYNLNQFGTGLDERRAKIDMDRQESYREARE